MTLSNATEDSVGENNLFAGAYLSNSIFNSGYFNGTNFSGANMHNSTLHHSTFSYADFSNANLKGSRFSGSDLTGADFTGANLEEVTWWDPIYTYYDWYPTICPDGTSADLVGNTCIGHMVY
jgi:uncharacterized protein YjbI with pentapeptide repeats